MSDMSSHSLQSEEAVEAEWILGRGEVVSTRCRCVVYPFLWCVCVYIYIYGFYIRLYKYIADLNFWLNH